MAHIAQAITRILAYTEELDETAFLANDLVQDGVVRNIKVIGEACHGIEVRVPAFAAAHHPELPLANRRGARAACRFRPPQASPAARRAASGSGPARTRR